MKNRYEEFVFEAEEGITFVVSEGTSGKLIIRAHSFDKAKVKSENYANPPIPEGYKHIYGEWSNGFVIERVFDGSQLVWIPVGSLDSNGTLDGVSFTEKFGRRNYLNNEFSESGFHETFTRKLALQLISVKKYGGFYISRYNISMNKKTGKPQSVKGERPWTDIDFNDAKKVAKKFEKSDTITSHLPFGAEYDSILEWFIKSNARTRSEVVEDSTNWGNHWKNARDFSKGVVNTGSSEEWSTNNIFDFAGNVAEWTQEKLESCYRVFRGCGYYDKTDNNPAAYRNYSTPEFGYDDNGFRVALCIK